MVRTITLSDGKKIPAIGWGNGTGGLQKSGSKAVDIGKVALEAGIHHIDTAQYYETEEETRDAIAASGLKRADVWVTTKGELTVKLPMLTKQCPTTRVRTRAR
jgi:diketogulonate reductase-like aldo/keto reductase